MTAALDLASSDFRPPSIDAIRQERARKGLLAFTQYTKPDYETNWHHAVVCDALDRFVSGKVKRLMVFMPPRSGKSELVSRRLPAYLLGRNPDTTIIAASYGKDLASRMNRDVQRIIDDARYRKLFPKTALYGKAVRSSAEGVYLRNSDVFEIVGKTGYYMSTGVGGAITGMGAHVAIIDDPIKNRKEADSETFRNAIHDWYTSTLYTRLTPDGRLLLTVTRWHEDDLAGRLLTLMKTDPEADQWEVVELPAEAEEPIPTYDRRKAGEALWPSRWDKKKLETTKRVIGSRNWNALYQQRPAPASGNVFQLRWWRYWIPRNSKFPPVRLRIEDVDYVIEPVELPLTFDELLQSWDLTFKDNSTNDFVAGQVWGRLGSNKYLLDYLLARMDIVDTIKAILRLSERYPSAITKLVEDKANGPAVIRLLRDKLTGLIPVEPEGGKLSRAYAAQPEVESGNIYLPHPQLFPWVTTFRASAAAFPNAAHDDDVDAFTQAIIRMQAANTGRPLAVTPQVSSSSVIRELFG